MTAQKLFIALFLTTFYHLGHSQCTDDPEIDSWMYNTTGHLAEYEYYSGPPMGGATYVQMTDSSDIIQVCYDTDDVWVRTNGLASYLMGPWIGNPNTPSADPSVYRIPRNPVEESGAKQSTPFGGAQGIAVNGVKIYGYGDGRSYSNAMNSNTNGGDGYWDTDAWVSEGSTMDASGNGHPTDMGAYHYHANPSTLYTDPSTSHSPIVGYAFDGFPIYGPFGYDDPMDSTSSVVRIESSYQLRNITTRDILPDGTTLPPSEQGPVVDATFPLGTYIQDYEYVSMLSHLDEYNGRFCYTPEYPDGTYAYFLTTESNGDPKFPYVLAAEFYGELSMMDLNNQGSFTLPTGGSCCDGSSDPVSINQNKELAPTALTIFPNPTGDVLNIRLGTLSSEEGQIKILSASGQLIFEQPIILTANQLIALDQTAQLPTGMYFLQISLNNGSQLTEKFIKN